MSKKYIIIVAIVVILVILGIIFLIFGQGKSQKQTEEILPEEQKQTINQEADEEEEQELIDRSSELKLQLTIKARAFIERYRTYSSDSNYQNLEELLSLMNEGLAAEAEAKIEKGIDQKAGFFTVVTKIMSIELMEFIPDSSAFFRAQIQEQNMSPGETNVLYKIAELSFVKVGNDWLVDEINIK